MTLKTTKTYLVFNFLALTWLMGSIACGPDAGMYQGETLTFETPVTSKQTNQGRNVKKAVKKLDLGADESSDFLFTRLGIYAWGPTPTFDYYREPVPVEIPVNPFFSVVDFVHPFYAFAALNGLWPVDDEDDGFYGPDFD